MKKRLLLVVMVFFIMIFASSCAVVQQAYEDTFSSFQDQENYRELIMEDIQSRLRSRKEESIESSLLSRSSYIKEKVIYEERYNKLLTEEELDELIEEIETYEKENNILWQSDRLEKAQSQLADLFPNQRLEVYGLVLFSPNGIIAELYNPEVPKEVDRYMYRLPEKVWKKEGPVDVKDAFVDWFHAELQDLDFKNASRVYLHGMKYIEEEKLYEKDYDGINQIQLLPNRGEEFHYRVYHSDGRGSHELLYDGQGEFLKDEVD
ncbi:MAG: hypothetical protein Q4G11_00885 [Gallicola sp.]|nr:hypothetical protein [Gallicola sp.]